MMIDFEDRAPRPPIDLRRRLLLATTLILGAISLAACDSPNPEPEPTNSAASAAEAAPDPAAEEVRVEERRKGFHCLSAWDGFNRDLVRKVKEDLRDPNSFEHADTTIGPVTDRGNHPIRMEYRARNGFGGMDVAMAVAAVDPETCEATIITSPEQIDTLLGNGG